VKREKDFLRPFVERTGGNKEEKEGATLWNMGKELGNEVAFELRWKEEGSSFQGTLLSLEVGAEVLRLKSS